MHQTVFCFWVQLSSDSQASRILPPVNIIQCFIHPNSLIKKKKTRDMGDIMTLWWSFGCFSNSFEFNACICNLLYSCPCNYVCLWEHKQSWIQVFQQFSKRWHQYGHTNKWQSNVKTVARTTHTQKEQLFRENVRFSVFCINFLWTQPINFGKVVITYLISFWRNQILREEKGLWTYLNIWKTEKHVRHYGIRNKQ